MARRINAAGLRLIKSFEGFEPKWYRDPVGIWTIGFGHTDAAGAPKHATSIREQALTHKQVEAQAAYLRSIEEQRERIRAAIEPNNTVREAKKVREEQLEQERLDFLAAQILRRT